MMGVLHPDHTTRVRRDRESLNTIRFMVLTSQPPAQHINAICADCHFTAAGRRRTGTRAVTSPVTATR